MSDESFEFWDFFPIHFDDQELQEYITHHITHMQKCCDNALYSSAYPHLHILYMTFVYIQLLRIAQEKREIFQYSWIGFGQQEKEFLKKPTHPLSFSPINEKSVFRFFRLVGFDDGTISDLSALVNERNENHHAKGTLACKDSIDFEHKTNEYTRRMRDIVMKQSDFLDTIYQQIITTFEADYVLSNDDIELNFGNFSSSELEILSKIKHDFVSKYIYQEFLGLVDE